MKAMALQVIRLSDGAQAPATISAAALDVAVLAVPEAASWQGATGMRPPPFGRVDVTHSGELYDCQAIGYPLWQLDPRHQHRAAAEVHGVIRATEGAESSVLILRDPLLWDVAIPDSVSLEDRDLGSPWGGLSGALVFYQGTALGIIIEHHPRQGHSALTVLPIQRIAALAGQGNLDALHITRDLCLQVSRPLSLVQPVYAAGLASDRVALGIRAEHPSDWPDQAGRLEEIVVTALRAAGISPDRCERQPYGEDASIILLPPAVAAGPTLPSMLLAAQLAAKQASNAPGADGRLRLIMSLADGPVQLTSGRYVGPGITAACDMLESSILGKALDAQGKVALAAMISDDLYLRLGHQGFDLWEAPEVHAIDMPVPGTTSTSRCWLFIPQGSSSAKRVTAFAGFSGSSPIASPAAIAAIPLAGMAALAWWETGREHHEPRSAQAVQGHAAGPASWTMPALTGQHEPLTPHSVAHDPWSSHLSSQVSQQHDQGMDHPAEAYSDSYLDTPSGHGHQESAAPDHAAPSHHLDNFTGRDGDGGTGDSVDW